MGRKIPGRKHHGVRDIEKQRQLKLLSLKDKINAPPSNPDEQQIPKSLSHLIELKEKVKSGQIGLKRNRKAKQKFGSVGFPNTKQFKRISSLKKSREVYIQSEEDFNSSDNDDEEVLLKQMKEDERSKGTGQKDTGKLSKSQKRQRKLKERKLKKANVYAVELKSPSDVVKFGEVAHAPPSLSVPRKALSEDTPRPGKKNLLLKSIIEDAKEEKTVERKRNKNEKLQLGPNKVIDRKAKRKHMPHALRRQLDKQQKEVVEAYKLLKSKKYNNLKR